MKFEISSLRHSASAVLTRLAKRSWVRAQVLSPMGVLCFLAERARDFCVIRPVTFLQHFDHFERRSFHYRASRWTWEVEWACGLCFMAHKTSRKAKTGRVCSYLVHIPCTSYPALTLATYNYMPFHLPSILKRTGLKARGMEPCFHLTQTAEGCSFARDWFAAAQLCRFL